MDAQRWPGWTNGCNPLHAISHIPVYMYMYVVGAYTPFIVSLDWLLGPSCTCTIISILLVWFINIQDVNAWGCAISQNTDCYCYCISKSYSNSGIQLVITPRVLCISFNWSSMNTWWCHMAPFWLIPKYLIFFAIIFFLVKNTSIWLTNYNICDTSFLSLQWPTFEKTSASNDAT